MADICIIYAHPSKPIVRKLYGVLSERYTVWWDEEIHSGDYRAEIEHQLAQARCVIPVWCRVSRADEDVVDEAAFAKRRGVLLMPVRIENVEPPLGFGSLHTVDLIEWGGEPQHPGLLDLLRNIDRLETCAARLLPRALALTVNGRSLAFPTFFKSVSSFETQLRPEAAVRALSLLGTDAMLVSAYDMVKDGDSNRIADQLEVCRSAGTMVLLDSGNYEAYRKGDSTWDPEGLRSAIARTPHDLVFCFDDLEPPSDVECVVRRVVDAVNRDSQHAGTQVLPIVHAPRDKSRLARADLVPEVMKRVARELRPTILAVPERELGDGLLSRARVVYETRRCLDELGFYQPLHLLGTGNPISIAVFAALGADCFDGLEWCRTVVDHQTGRLYHFQQYEFFAWQSGLAESPIVREAVASGKVEFSGKVVFHNLEFFSTWMRDLGVSLRSGKIDRFLSEKLPTGGMRLFEQAVPEVFG